MPSTTYSPQPTRLWLLEHVCPFWCARIVDPQGGFFEALDASGQAIQSATRTVLNQARLTYVFSHATLLGGDESLRGAADHGFDFLRRASAITGSFEGWHRITDNNGKILDHARDAYDHAFVIFAMAWYYRASASQEALHLAGQAYAFLENHMADAAHGGFFEEYPATDKLPRRQNPHMHLLEAVLAMHTATGDQVWFDRASKLISLFMEVFLDKKTGSLAEFFNADWRPASGAPSLLREPGHQFEWVWLLQQYMQQGLNTGIKTDTHTELEVSSKQLFDFGSRNGIDAHDPLQGLVFDEVNAAGLVTKASKLLWPQTEYIKACIAYFDATKDVKFKHQALAHMKLMRTHFFYADDANWVNHIARDGAHLVTQTPSRVLYHLFLAASELIRIGES